MPTFKVQFDYTGRSTKNIKALETVNSRYSYLFALRLRTDGAKHVKKIPLQMYSTELRTGIRQPVGCLQSVVEFNFGQQKTKLAARDQSGI